MATNDLKLKLYHDIFNRSLPPLEQVEYRAEQEGGAHNWHLLGQTHFQKLQFSQAVKCLSRSIELDPAPWEPYLHRGLAWVIMGQFEPAIADFDAVLERRPDQFEALYNRGRVYARLQRDEEAIADFEKARQVNRRAALQLRVPRALRHLKQRRQGRRPTPLHRLLNLIDEMRAEWSRVS